jgi:hypothetical protein
MNPRYESIGLRLTLLFIFSIGTAAQIPVDLKDYLPNSGITVQQENQQLRISWPLNNSESGHLWFNLAKGEPLIETIGAGPNHQTTFRRVMEKLEPVFFLTAGERRAPPGRPPSMPIWNVFFDKPADRPHFRHRSILEPERVRVASRGRRVSVTMEGLNIGNFSGQLQFHFYSGTGLLHIEAVVSTSQDRRAILYDFGLLGEDAGWQVLAWMNTHGEMQSARANASEAARALAVRHRIIVAETAGGALACFPPPHQFFFPVDHTDNFKYAWFGRGYQQETNAFGFGIRQDPINRGAFVPWFNAPPGTQQRLGVFLLLGSGNAAGVFQEALRYTRGDRFARLPGHTTLSSHFHMAVAVTAMQMKEKNPDKSLPIPEFVEVFKNMGVDAVHLAEFHGDGHPRDPGPLRLPEMEAMFEQCERLSDDALLLIPGEEANVFLGLNEPGKHPGHWMSLFPRPVYWIMQRKPDQPFAESHPKYGTLYRVGSREDMIELLKREGGLAWTAHPRIKASSWTPDIFREEDFYKADYWLGAAWKAMPADLSREKLGERCLDLLDDMSNWGPPKYLPGEVDVFKIDRTHELFGHMNVNYLRLDRLPRYREGWQPILDGLRSGRFFTTTGEILIRSWTLGGRQSGETLPIGQQLQAEMKVELDWTFPLQFLEVISGDGQRVYRQRIDMGDTPAFGQRTVNFPVPIKGRKWFRLEAWDVAVNGAYTQQIWLE